MFKFDDVNEIISEISKLRYELMTNKPLSLLLQESDFDDIKTYNHEIQR